MEALDTGFEEPTISLRIGGCDDDGPANHSLVADSGTTLGKIIERHAKLTMVSELVDGLTGVILAVTDTPAMRRYWRQWRIPLHPGFGFYVDNLIDKEGEAPMEIYRATAAG